MLLHKQICPTYVSFSITVSDILEEEQRKISSKKKWGAHYFHGIFATAKFRFSNSSSSIYNRKDQNVK